MEENREATRLYQIVSGQLIIGLGGAVGINLLAVKMVMDLYGVNDQIGTMEKIIILSNEYLRLARKKSTDNDDL